MDLAQTLVEIREAAERLLEQGRGLPRDEVLVGAGVAAAAFLVAAIAWLRAARRGRRLRRELADLRAREAALQAKYDAEVKWRLASEKERAPAVVSEA